MDERNKLAFWAVAVAAFLIVCVPSTILLEALARYKNYVEGVDASTLRPTRVRFIPHRDGRRSETAPSLDFVEFTLKRPKAKKVSLIGDFNGWKADALPLAKQPDGAWQLMLPLPKGRHAYLFVVDGKETADPAAKETVTAAGRTACVKVVK